MGAPATAHSAEVSLYFGATVATEYVSDGIRFSNGPTVQPYVELGFAGLHAGAYVSNVDANLTGANAEYDLSVGRRGEAGKLGYNIGIAYYSYDEAVADYPAGDSAETCGSVTLAATDTLYLTVKAAFAPENDQTNLSMRADYDPALDGLSVGAIIGQVNSNYGDWNYWSINAACAVFDKVSAGLAYHDTNLDPALGLADRSGLIVTSSSLAL